MTTFLSRSISRRVLPVSAVVWLAACDASFLHDVESRREATDRGCPAPNDGAHDVTSRLEADGSLTITWTSSATNADGWLVERQSSREPVWGEIGAVSALTFNDTRVVLDEEYNYRVSAVRGAGGSVCTTPASAPITARTVPKAAEGMLARATAVGQITVIWDDVNTFEDGYRVSRSVAGGPFAQLGIVARNGEQLVDTNVTPGVLYAYLLVAFNASGDSAPVQDDQLGVTPATLSWTDAPFIGPQCSLEVFGAATYDAGASFESSFGRIDGERTNAGTASGFSGSIDPSTAGAIVTDWVVDDTNGGRATLSRTLTVVQTATPRSRRHMPDYAAGEATGRGVQPVDPACGNCNAAPRASISAGVAHTCEVLQSGRVMCWGVNDSTQLGHGDVEQAYTAQRPCSDATATCVGGPVMLTAVSAGVDYGCGITNDQHALCWGDGGAFKLGRATEERSSVPVPVCAAGAALGCTTQLAGVTQISAGTYTACAIAAGGEVWCWGAPLDGTDDHPPRRVCADGAVPCTPFTADEVSVGNGNACARKGDEVWCWGSYYRNIFGTDDAGSSAVPIPVCTSGTGVSCVPLDGVTDVELGDYFACARKADATLVCWGLNNGGQLGTSSTNGDETVPSPVCVAGDSGVCTQALAGVTSFSAGHDHACAVVGGEVYCWGRNDYGQVGSIQTSVLRVATPVCQSGTMLGCPRLTGIAEVSAGQELTCARRADGTAVCWGYDSASGNAEVPAARGLPVPVCASGAGPSCDPLQGITAISTQHYLGLAVADGQLRSWGNNASGELALPLPPLSEGPAEVQMGAGADRAPLTDVRAVHAGVDSSCALRNDGTVWCWGWDRYGLFGVSPNGYYESRGYATPVCASGTGSSCEKLGGVVSLAVGAYHACAANAAGQMWCWGGDDCGETGRGIVMSCDGDVEPVPQPHSVSADASNGALTDVAEVAAGAGFTCVLKRSGQVLCFGDNRLGTVGAGLGAPNVRFPAAVCDATDGPGCVPWSDLVSVRAGYNHACAIRQNGTMICWGADDCGELGNPQTTICSGGSRSDARVACVTDEAPCVPIGNIVDVSAGISFTCVLREDGSVGCWGTNNLSELGQGYFSVAASLLAPTVDCGDGACGTTCTTPLQGVVAISSGGSHTCVIRESGETSCWGLSTAYRTGSDTNIGLQLCSAAPSCRTGDTPSCPLNDVGDVRTCNALSVVVP